MTPDSPSLDFQHLAPELRLFCGEDSLAALAPLGLFDSFGELDHWMRQHA